MRKKKTEEQEMISKVNYFSKKIKECKLNFTHLAYFMFIYFSAFRLIKYRNNICQNNINIYDLLVYIADLPLSLISKHIRKQDCMISHTDSFVR